METVLVPCHVLAQRWRASLQHRPPGQRLLPGRAPPPVALSASPPSCSASLPSCDFSKFCSRSASGELPATPALLPSALCFLKQQWSTACRCSPRGRRQRCPRQQCALSLLVLAWVSPLLQADGTAEVTPLPAVPWTGSTVPAGLCGADFT